MTAEVKISELPEAIVPLTGTELIPVVQSNITRKVAASALISAVNVGTTTTGLPGTDAEVVNSGVGLSVVLDFTIPRGATGATGSTGTAATITAGTATAVATGNPPTVTNSGSSSAAVFDFGIPTGATGATGAKGDTGDTGATGAAATVAAGTTTTGAAGSSATVVNSGSSSAAVFDFTIPRGNTGATGDTGSQGVPGINWLGTWSGATTYALRDAVAYNGSSYYAIAGNTNQAPPNATYWNILALKGVDGSGSVSSVGLSAPALFTVSNSPVTSSGTLDLSYSGTALPVANGGTNATTAQTAINNLAGAVTSGSYLRGNGTNVVMSAVQAADIPTLNQNTTGTASNVTGTVAVANGGTGATTLTLNNVILGNNGSAVQVVAPGTSGNVLTSNGTTWSSTTPAAGVSLSAANTWTATQTFNGSSSTFGAVLLDSAETVNIVAAAPAATTNLYVQSGSVQYYTSNAANNFIVNIAFSAGTTMNAALAIGQVETAALITTQNATAYYGTAVYVDGTATGVTTKWIGGAPTAGNASGLDTYRFAVIKTASATYTVLASLTQYK
jgi:hypothetical protein